MSGALGNRQSGKGVKIHGGYRTDALLETGRGLRQHSGVTAVWGEDMLWALSARCPTGWAQLSPSGRLPAQVPQERLAGRLCVALSTEELGGALVFQLLTFSMENSALGSSPCTIQGGASGHRQDARGSGQS